MIEPALTLHAELTVQILAAFIKEEAEKAGFTNIVLGLSGGIDSALVAYLAVRSLGADKVFAVMMPYRTSSPRSVADATEVVEDLGIPWEKKDITPMVDAYFQTETDATNLRRGNKMARERMSILYDMSAKRNALVLGTSNKTELLLGYGTQHGDIASAINPIGDLYKTQVRQLSRFLGVPASILEKPPSADLWADQSDETELGFTYEEVDRLLYYMIDRQYSKEELARRGFDPAFIEQVDRRIRINQYKRRMPLIAKLSNRTIGVDYRYPRDWGL